MRGFITRPLGQVLVAAAIALGAGGIYVTQVGGGAAPSGTANLWVDTNGGTCTFQSTPAAYSDAAACATLTAGYAAANTGSSSASTVAVKTGSYSSQSTPNSTRTGGVITFVEDGGDVTLNSLAANGDKAKFVGFTIANGVDLQGEVSGTMNSTTRIKDITFDGVSAQGANGAGAVFITNAEDITFENGEICCGSALISDSAEAVRTNFGTSTTASARLTFDNNDIHDWDRDVEGTHSECMLMLSVQTLTITNNRFYRCTVMAISLARLASEPGALDPSNTLIANNTFAPSDLLTPGDEDAFNTMTFDHVGVRYANLAIRNNSIAQPILFETADVPDSTGFDQTVVESNIIRNQASCGLTTVEPTFRGNLMDAGTCGGTDTDVADVRTGWVTAGTGGVWDFHLKSGAAAIGAASSTSGQFTATDIGGRARDGDPDAGAYEFASGS